MLFLFIQLYFLPVKKSGKGNKKLSTQGFCLSCYCLLARVVQCSVVHIFVNFALSLRSKANPRHKVRTGPLH